MGRRTLSACLPWPMCSVGKGGGVVCPIHMMLCRHFLPWFLNGAYASLGMHVASQLCSHTITEGWIGPEGFIGTWIAIEGLHTVHLAGAVLGMF